MNSTANKEIGSKLGEKEFLLTYFLMEGPTCTVKRGDIQGMLEGTTLNKGDISGAEFPWIDTTLLNFKQRFKQRVWRLLARFAIKRGPTYCFTEASYNTFKNEFIAIQREFLNEVDSFSSNLNHHIEGYIASKPHLEKLVRSVALTESEIRARFRFDMAVPTRLQAHNESEQEDLVLEVEESFWQQVSTRAKELLKALAGREHGTQKALNPVRDLADLIMNNQSLSDRVEHVGLEIWTFVEGLQRTGNIQGQQFLDTVRYLGLLASDECLDAFREKRLPELSLDLVEEDEEEVLPSPLQMAPWMTSLGDSPSAPETTTESEHKIERAVQRSTALNPFKGGVNTLF